LLGWGALRGSNPRAPVPRLDGETSVHVRHCPGCPVNQGILCCRVRGRQQLFTGFAVSFAVNCGQRRAHRVWSRIRLRQGEVLGLKWEDVDLDHRKLKVRRALQRIDGALILKEPKTEKSRRTLTLPASLVAALCAHRDRQTFEQATAGDRWQESGLVFTTTRGTPLDPRNVIRSWHRIQAAYGLPRRNFHSTRHTAASLMLAEGVPVKVVLEVLRHSLLSTTADTYGHLFPEAFDQAADAIERALTG